MFGEPGTDMDRSEREGITTSEAFLAVSEWPRRRGFSEIAPKKGLLGNSEGIST